MTDKAKSEESRERLAQALRRNLRRRKAQARGRADSDDEHVQGVRPPQGRQPKDSGADS